MVDLVNSRQQVVFGKDSIIIQKWITGIKGGRNLDVSEFPLKVISAGHVVITDGNGLYKPMPLTSEPSRLGDDSESVTYTYGSLPEGFHYAGVVYRSVLVERPMVSIMTQGQVNSVAMPYEVPEDFKDDCPLIEFIKDEPSK